ncbi:pyrroline-5-carboxylate reductase [Pseudoxanthomonas gei]|uniref:Pyrroline-5-carboxylate reductase n=1 Tax=Pseudoxanthomonas gei TaxID=1383030 RepID=A0ABX0AC31_9GAMM|nr:pyrroline-5-carboxylate reductase [Pseudoxanthomonas gei]NDK39140.1 pyrroline-5-carboxylate reductase [Pseudoxanthomonas gei]
MSTAPTLSPLTTTHSIAFVGGGNMARSLIGALIARGSSATQIRVAEPVEAVRQSLARDFGVAVFADARDACADADLWLLAVKPQVMRNVCEDLADLAQSQRALVVSIAAGITAVQLQRWLGGDAAVIRAMPNTPALLGAGMTGLFARGEVDAAGRQRAQDLLASAGKTIWIEDEASMDAVTAVSGSGPAYVFLLAEAMEAAARQQGLDGQAARTLVLQTVLGAARMLTESDESPGTLRQRVTSPNGTTQAAIEALQAGQFGELVATAIKAATERGRALSAAND